MSCSVIAICNYNNTRWTIVHGSEKIELNRISSKIHASRD